MITGYFGVPGCGKTTLLSSLAYRENNRIVRGKSKYKGVLTNFECEGCYKVDFTDIGVYDIEGFLILLDEITVDADNRDFKRFKKSSVEGFVYHRHYCNDIVYATQQFDAVDKKIRNLTFDLWCMKSGYILPITKCKRIFRITDIDDHSHDIVLGYRFADFKEVLLSLFLPSKLKITRRIWRPSYYGLFDTLSKPLQLLPFNPVAWADLRPDPTSLSGSDPSDQL